MTTEITFEDFKNLISDTIVISDEEIDSCKNSVDYLQQNFLKWFAEGISVDIDKLPDDVVEKLKIKFLAMCKKYNDETGQSCISNTDIDELFYSPEAMRENGYDEEYIKIIQLCNSAPAQIEPYD